MEKKQSIGALWKGQGKSGNYLSGKIEINGSVHDIIIFQNDYKKEPKHPDYRIFEKIKKEGLPDVEPVSIDEIPF